MLCQNSHNTILICLSLLCVEQPRHSSQRTPFAFIFKEIILQLTDSRLFSPANHWESSIFVVWKIMNHRQPCASGSVSGSLIAGR